MVIHPMRPQEDTEEMIEKMVEMYSGQLFRLCFTILRNSADAEDAVSNTFIKYLTKAPAFLEEEHRKAWLIRVATNICKDMLRAGRYRQHLDLNAIHTVASPQTDNTVLEEMLRIPEKYRTVLYLYYIEGYRTGEIAQMLSISPATARKRLQHGRKKLKLEHELER